MCRACGSLGEGGASLWRMVTVITVWSCCTDLGVLHTFVLGLVVTASQTGLQGWWMGYPEAQGRSPCLGVAQAAAALTTLNCSHVSCLPQLPLQSGALETLALGSQFRGGGYPEPEWELTVHQSHVSTSSLTCVTPHQISSSRSLSFPVFKVF